MSESVLPSCVAAARRAVGVRRGTAGARHPDRARPGYRFIAAVKERRDSRCESRGCRRCAVWRATAIRRHMCRAMARRRRAFGEQHSPAADARRAGRRARHRQDANGGVERRGAPARRADPGRPRLRGRGGAGVLAVGADPARTARARASPAGCAPRRELARSVRWCRSPRRRRRRERAEANRRASVCSTASAASSTARQRQPLLLVLDDLHWADEASLRLLGFLAPSSPTPRLRGRDLSRRRAAPRSTRSASCSARWRVSRPASACRCAASRRRTPTPDRRGRRGGAVRRDRRRPGDDRRQPVLHQEVTGCAATDGREALAWRCR